MLDIDWILADMGYPEWEGDDTTLTCPCGWVIEHDGKCPDGCVSPLRLAGLI